MATLFWVSTTSANSTFRAARRRLSTARQSSVFGTFRPASNRPRTAAFVKAGVWALPTASVLQLPRVQRTTTLGARRPFACVLRVHRHNRKSVVDLPGYLRITHDFALATETPDLFRVNVTIENISGALIEDVRYTRTFDWDVEPDTYQDIVTVQGTGSTGTLLNSTNNGFNNSGPVRLPVHNRRRPGQHRSARLRPL